LSGGGGAGPFEAFYDSALQHPWLLWAAVAVGVACLLRRRDLDPRLRRYGLGLGALSLADAWLTSSHVYGVGALEGRAASAVPLLFVLAGDLRFLLLVTSGTPAGGLRPTAASALAAAGLTALVPLLSQGLVSALPAEHAGPRTLFLVYELFFLALAAGLAAFHPGPRRTPWLRGLCGFVALYYALWATADAAILGAGADWGFGLRAVPNALYYGGFLVALAWLPPAPPPARRAGCGPAPGPSRGHG